MKEAKCTVVVTDTLMFALLAGQAALQASKNTVRRYLAKDLSDLIAQFAQARAKAEAAAKAVEVPRGPDAG